MAKKQSPQDELSEFGFVPETPQAGSPQSADADLAEYGF